MNKDLYKEEKSKRNEIKKSQTIQVKREEREREKKSYHKGNSSGYFESLSTKDNWEERVDKEGNKSQKERERNNFITREDNSKILLW